MAKKKRKTLPKNFNEMLENDDMTNLKTVFDTCELDAKGGYDKGTALHFYDISKELMHWLVEQGADVNARNSHGETPLHKLIDIELSKLLLDLGADINASDYGGGTPLHTAAGFFRADTVKLFVERGANIHATNNSGQTPLAYALEACRNANIPQMAEIAVSLIAAGSEVTPDMMESVRNIGKEFEFSRESFNKDSLAETDAGLARLYESFDVVPVAERRMHDGVSPITLPDGNWAEQYEELWDFLIPSQGAAKTVQGEVIRITGRIRDELYRNGGTNWDGDYRKMLDALLKHFSSGTPLKSEELTEASEIASIIRSDGDGDIEITDRLCELAVKWVKANPEPVVLTTPEYKR